MNGPILLTGGNGRLGRELLGLLEDVVAPPRAELDVTRPDSIDAAFSRHRPALVVHAAAYTDVSGAEREREACWRVNVEGTQHLVRALLQHGGALVHVSTDYVFEGMRGGYREEDVPGPARNYYALTKLVSEAVARLVPEHLVLRTSFRPREWPYPVAFEDVYTSQDYVDVIAPEVALAIRNRERIPYQTLHIATERKSVYELARRRRADVQAGSKRTASVDLPDDISLDVGRWEKLKETFAELDGR